MAKGLATRPLPCPPLLHAPPVPVFPLLSSAFHPSPLQASQGNAGYSSGRRGMSGAMSAFCQVVLRLSVSREPNPTRTPVLALSSVLPARPLPTPRGASELGAPESAGHFRRGACSHQDLRRTQRELSDYPAGARCPRICGALSPEVCPVDSQNSVPRSLRGTFAGGAWPTTEGATEGPR